MKASATLGSMDARNNTVCMWVIMLILILPVFVNNPIYAFENFTPLGATYCGLLIAGEVSCILHVVCRVS